MFICNSTYLLQTAYEDGRQAELFALEGTIPVKFKGKYLKL